MSVPYRLFGSELSPYSVKVRSYLRYKRIPHEWIVRSSATEAEFNQYAKLPLVPLVVTPEGAGWQDSTPILEKFEKIFPEPAIQPADPVLAFLSALLEEYGDEWGNKPMFHYRWFYPADCQSAASRLAQSMMPGMPDEQIAGGVEMIKNRMVPRLALVGSSAATKDQIEGSFRRQIAILEAHLSHRPYLFGKRPAFGDFGVFAQLYECLTDPTPGAILRAEAPHVAAWCERMLDPVAEGEFEAWPTLAASLTPLLRDEVGALFLPWSAANAAALAAGEKEFSLSLAGRPFSQETQKYHAKSLAALRARYAAIGERAALDAILRDTGCLAVLQS